MDLLDPDLDLEAPAVSDEDWQRVVNFNKALDAEQIQLCARCKVRWFNMRLRENAAPENIGMRVVFWDGQIVQKIFRRRAAAADAIIAAVRAPPVPEGLPSQ
ncbi:hypothetical protein K402DRAFT_423720 [Aulographum hederae CBS 113979]|uniref:Uncharacterized protein n=1 Tax=Aulographum hederae CBS 113979 TaxID=1176131 RepID=A0A6G1GRE8_9PEZI|nr:hypothetical protein K402DRAFT_423720 [Aulographum hederae CBS 113979]